MPSVRTSFSLDAVRDHELIEWLVELQADGRASDVIRTALNEHRKMRVTLSDVMAELHEIKERLATVSLQSSVVKVSESAPVPAASDELERRLEKTLGRFRRD
jgi:DNA repair exonuclease SbcCD ATPase subunit